MSSDTNSDTDIVLVEETKVREEIKYTNMNMARLRRDIPDIIRDIVREELEKFFRELRKPKPPIEVGYKY